ncbi:HtaA domain-containing protein [Salinibacterium hongtaonis]|uniref:HtaA domain-containing protein n=1 Tax=Homoserinimonas hongtaonis TaxID=2079791 RepID=UPI000D37426D|nr:HtaA domain-containing protein [Salinibacterium hongtaonis]AWB88424.1 hypothetical protein C2138_01645 [Salinibacterium hongtaonis]
MNPLLARPRAARSLLALLTAFLLAFSGLVMGAAPASAAPSTSSTALHWGFKQSWRTYMQFGGGSVTPSAGAAVVSTPFSAYTWAPGATTFDPVSKIGSAAFSGAVQFVNAGHGIDVSVSAPRVDLNGDGTGSIFWTTGGVEVLGATVSTLSVGAPVDSSGVSTVNVAGSGVAFTDASGVPFHYTSADAMDDFAFQISYPTPAVAPPTPPTPKVTVSKTTGLNPAGETITVSGTGFSPADSSSVVGTRPPLAGLWSGAYVVFGSFKDVWKPSESAPTAARESLSQRWLLTQDVIDAVDPRFKAAVLAEAAVLNADGSFSFQMTVAESSAALSDGNYGIYTYAGSGATYAPFETYTPLSFGIPTPKVTVSKTTGLNPAGETITVSGTGFSPADSSSVVGTRPPLAGLWSGAYVVFGSFKDVWKPSESAPTAARESLSQRWLLTQDVIDAVDPRFKAAVLAEAAVLNADGSFSFQMTVAESSAALSDGNYGIYTYAGSGATYAPFETYTPLAFGAPTPPVVTPPTTTPPVVDVPVASGSLTWGIKDSFRSYITSSIAHGTISTSGARASGGSYVFGQAAGGSYTEAAGVGTSNYSGAVRFTGHAGILDVTISNPVVRVDSATSGTLFVTANGSQLAIASLNLAAANRSVNNGAVTYSGVPAVLTSAGTGVFALTGSPFYPVGTALDPVTFTIGAPATASVGSAMVASFQRPATATPAPTAPVTTGAEIVEGDVAPGSTVTIRATGFQPNETGILVVLYSTPTVLDRNATADANGVVTWTGVLPSDFTGEHTLTFQGSVDRGVVVDFGSAAVAALASCVVENATVTWGFKESFRAYISGSIAHGEWVVGEGLEYETPDFLWKTGSGTFDADEKTGDIALPGTLTFTGHGGVLNTTLSNLRVKFDGDTAFLVFDISGDTQAGETIDERNVSFVELDLSAATETDDDGEITFADVPAKLTADGEATFGTYSAGEAFDPVTITIAQSDGCDEVAATEEASDDATVAPISAQPDLTWVVWLLVALVVILAAVVVTLLVRARRKQN